MLKERIKAILSNHFRSYGMTYELRLETELEAFAREIRNEVLEEAAKAADTCYRGIGPVYNQDIGHMLRCMKENNAEQEKNQ